jgi:hypothetical protein
MALNGNSDETNGYNSVIARGELSDPHLLKAVFPPLGAVMPWRKNDTGTPSLPDGFVECDGSTISDSDSPYDGEDVPDYTDRQAVNEWVEVGSGSLSGTSTNIAASLSDVYSQFMIQLSGCTSSSGTSNLTVTLNGASTNYEGVYIESTSSAVSTNTSATSSFNIGSCYTSGYLGHFKLFISRESGNYAHCRWSGYYYINSSSVRTRQGDAVWKSTAAITTITVNASVSTTGTYRVTGLINSSADDIVWIMRIK